MDTPSELDRNAYYESIDAGKPSCHECHRTEREAELVWCGARHCDHSICAECSTEAQWHLEACSEALKYTTGRAVSGTYGPQMMYTTVDDRVFFLDPPIAASLEALNPRKGEPVRIAKVRRSGSDACDWDIERVQAAAPAEPRNHSKNGSQNIGLFAQDGNPASAMADCFRSALDAIAEAQEYSNRKALGIAFTSDNVTSTALSAYINRLREGKAA